MKKIILLFMIIISYNLYSGSWKIIGSVSSDQIYGYNVIDNYISWSGKDVWIIDSTQGLVDDEELIMTSTDYGETWFKSLSLTGEDSLFGKSPYAFYPTQYNFDNLGIMILATHDQFIMTSTDLGKTWNARQILDKPYSFDSLEVAHISMADSIHGALSYLYINKGCLYVTDDGWKSWKLIELPERAPIHYLKRFDSSTYVTFSAINYPDFYYLKSTDAGKTWEKEYLKAKMSNNRGTYIKSKDEYWFHTLIKDGNKRNILLYKTSNSGKDWELKLDVPDTSWGGIRGIAFAKDGLHGVTINSKRMDEPKNYSYFCTDDGGETWKKYYLDSAFNGVFDLEKPVYRDKDYFFVNGTGFIAKIWINQDTLSIIDYNYLNNNVIIYPNPVERGSSITINIISNEKEKISIKIYDVKGKEIDHYEAEGINSGFNIIKYDPDTSLQPGAYIFIIETDGRMLEKKVIIQ